MARILITSALPYVNNEPHLGNLIGAVLSGDVYSRYCKLAGYHSVYICGTDEYGTATETKALQEGCSPQEICDRYHDVHRDIYERFDIDFDYFGRTSTPKHCEIVQEIFERDFEQGVIKRQTLQQLFCLVCDRFLADRFIRGRCPYCKAEEATGDQCDACQKSYEATELLEPVCFLCKAALVLRSSEHFYIDLEKQQATLQAFCEARQPGHWTNNAISIT